MALSNVLIANRGEIAVRLIRAAADLGLRTTAVYSTDDETALHTRQADEAIALGRAGAAAYLDGEGLLEVALQAGCDAVHPGYGFLSEQAGFARRCAEAGLTFVGPSPEVLDLFGDKVAARRLARQQDVAVLAGSDGPVTVAEARAFAASLPDGSGVMLKAVAGGGGRGMRAVLDPAGLEEAFERCRSEATAAFGNGAVYVEQYLPRARHVEIQILGDGTGRVVALGERDCSIQRRHQKVVEIAPAPGLPEPLRQRMTAAALRLGRAARYGSLGTVEFLVDVSAPLDADSPFFFIEANARLQVEHTVTEEVTGVDLVEAQLRLAGGATLAELGLDREEPPRPRGFAVQARINLETMGPDGSTRPSGGTLVAFDLPSGPGLRVDTFGYTGYRTSPAFDSLLAKLVVHRADGDLAAVARRTHRALSECRIEGVDTNLAFLQNIVAHPDFAAGRLSTRFIDDHLDDLVGGAAAPLARRFVELSGPPPSGAVDAGTASDGRAGARIDAHDPLAVLAYGKAAGSGSGSGSGSAAAASETAAAGTASGGAPTGPDGTTGVVAPLQGTVVAIAVTEGDLVRPGQLLAVMESMKMEHEVRADRGGTVRGIGAAVGEAIFEGHPLVWIEPSDAVAGEEVVEEQVDLDAIRPDLHEVLERRATTLDANRPKAVARRRATQQRTARENVEHLCDPGTFVEYGPLVVAAQRRRRSMEELIEKSPADGMITGVGRVNGDRFGDPDARCAVMAYDYTVFAGTQGVQNHRKTDRLIDIAEQGRLPLVLFAEGGGGRPGDTDGDFSSNTFARFAMLSGLVPMVGITSGFCFAGNASLLGCCDVIIATADSNIGMGGPAMIEGGGLGVYTPDEIGPMSVQMPSGVVDVAVADEAEAVAVAKRYLGYFQGRLAEWEEPDQRAMRAIVPENRLRIYDVRRVVDTLADVGSVLELRPSFGVGMVTSLIRIEGRPVGVIANNPTHLGGAIDSDGADKGARFMQLCDAFDLPILFLCDTPGIMVGPEIEKTALVRHSSRMFLVGANLSVPFFTIVVRKSYGLGGIAMAGGSFKTPTFSVAWPTGEFGGMGLEGSVKLAYRAELAAIDDPEERRAVYEEKVAKEYRRGRALNYATGFALDDTIDPAESRYWMANLLSSLRPAAPREGKKRPCIDGW